MITSESAPSLLIPERTPEGAWALPDPPRPADDRADLSFASPHERDAINSLGLRASSARHARAEAAFKVDGARPRITYASENDPHLARFNKRRECAEAKQRAQRALKRQRHEEAKRRHAEQQQHQGAAHDPHHPHGAHPREPNPKHHHHHSPHGVPRSLPALRASGTPPRSGGGDNMTYLPAPPHQPPVSVGKTRVITTFLTSAPEPETPPLSAREHADDGGGPPPPPPPPPPPQVPLPPAAMLVRTMEVIGALPAGPTPALPPRVPRAPRAPRRRDFGGANANAAKANAAAADVEGSFADDLTHVWRYLHGAKHALTLVRRRRAALWEGLTDAFVEYETAEDALSRGYPFWGTPRDDA